MKHITARVGAVSLVGLGIWWAASSTTPQPQTVAQTDGERLTPTLTAPVEVLDRMKNRGQRPVRVSGERASYLGSVAHPIEMRSIKPRGASVDKGGVTRVAGGRRIESP
ncbi:MAG: hypothetical protein AAFX85_02840, partial [Pseudomonadota bacterium]